MHHLIYIDASADEANSESLRTYMRYIPLPASSGNLGKLVEMFVYIARHLLRHFLFHIHELLFEVIKLLVLLIHRHKLVLIPFLLQVFPMRIVYLLCLVN